MEIAARLAEVRARVALALARCGDAARDVTIVAVTKGRDASAVEEVAAAGLRDVGENRVQEAVRKAVQVRAAVRWHLVGHLQGNKAARAASLFACIHSVDSERLVRALAAPARPLDVFLQVNVSGEASKTGVEPAAARPLWQAALRAPPLRVLGLMTMAPAAGGAAAARPAFRALRELRDELNRTGDGPPMPCLSMGMSGDFEVALEEGASHIRIGTALFGEILPRGR
jgi:pyridoxal phosphate enzyme (YggS family)